MDGEKRDGPKPYRGRGRAAAPSEEFHLDASIGHRPRSRVKPVRTTTRPPWPTVNDMAELPIVCTLTPAALKAREEGLLAGLICRTDERLDVGPVSPTSFLSGGLRRLATGTKEVDNSPSGSSDTASCDGPAAPIQFEGTHNRAAPRARTRFRSRTRPTGCQTQNDIPDRRYVIGVCAS